MKKYLKYIISLVIIFICVLCLIVFRTDNSTKNSISISEILIFKNGVEYEILVSNETKETFFREDETIEKIYSYPREPKYRLSIPKFDEIEGLNALTEDKLTMNFTYKISYADGSKYIKYLINEGYNIEMYISTSQYFECFLRGIDNYKRVVLFNDTVMVCDMDLSVELPSVADYLQSYNFNGFIDNKFNVIVVND